MIAIACSISNQAIAKYQLKYIPGAKIGPGIFTMTNEIELERKLVPFTRGYLRWGGAGYDVPGVSNVTINFNNIGIGVRYNLIFFHIGTGFEHSWLFLNNTKSNFNATGTMLGPVIEIGKSLRLGPVSIGGSLGVQLSKNTIKFNDAQQFSIGDFKSDSATVFKLECHAGYSF